MSDVRSDDQKEKIVLNMCITESCRRCKITIKEIRVEKTVRIQVESSRWTGPKHVCMTSGEKKSLGPN